MTTPNKIDLFKLHKAEYGATAKPRIVEVGAALYLAVDGHGAPGCDDFQEAIGALYASAYTLKFASKFAGRDFVVGKLEAVYWSDEGDDVQAMAATPRQQWRWTMMIRTPDFIGKRDLSAALKTIAAKGKTPGHDRVRLVKLREGKCVQALHIGPYEEMSETIAMMHEFAGAEALAPKGRHHDIYLSDPRRVEPARLKTILRQPVA